MKFLKTTILFIFLINVLLLQAQTTYTWTGGGTSDFFEDAANWSPMGTPIGGDNIIFDNVGTLTVTGLSINITSINDFSIINNSDVTFESSEDVMISVSNFVLDETSAFNILQIDFYIQLDLMFAEVSGSITLDGANYHKFFGTSMSVINFNLNSSFTAGSSLPGDLFPFGTTDLIVFFKNGSTYNHYGGGSPFGSPDFSVVSFEPESNYYIMEGDGSNVYFSGKTYGNIINESGIDIDVISSGTGPQQFIFNTLINNSGSITFEGSEEDEVVINSGISVVGGNIDLDCGLFHFAGNGFIDGSLTYSVNFDLNDINGQTFTVLSLGQTLDIFTNVNIVSTYGQMNVLNIEGTVNLITGELNFTDQNLTVSGNILCEGGILASSATSAINITAGTDLNMVLAFNETGGKNIIGSLILNRTGMIVEIASNLIVDNSLGLTAGKIKLTDFNLTLGTAITISGGGTYSYIITKDYGSVSSDIASGQNFEFPIGTEINYAPVSIYSGDAYLFSVNVKDSVYSNGYEGDVLTYDDIIGLTWEVETDAINYDMQLNWPTGIQNAGFVAADASIYNYDEGVNEWSIISSNDVIDTSISASIVDLSGLFMVSSHSNTLPLGENGEVNTDLNSDYIFSAANDFSFDFVKIMITQDVNDGVLYKDDEDGVFDAVLDEILTVDSEVFFSEIEAGIFKYHAYNEGTFSFNFKVSNGLVYSTEDYNMSIVVGTNIILAEDQIFNIPEYSPDGFEVGQIQSIETGATILYEMLAHQNGNAFDISSDGIITVTNSAMLVRAVNPQFEYPVLASDSNGETSEFLVTIILDEVNQGDFFVTNFISPNGDGVNDTWIVRGQDNGNYHVAVFDKRGNQVFHSENYMNNWDGTNNGRTLNPGVYYYVVRAGNFEDKGTITLLR